LGRRKGGKSDRLTSASSAAMYFTSPSSETLALTASVRATGEKTARAPDCRRTMKEVSKSKSRKYDMDGAYR